MSDAKVKPESAVVLKQLERRSLKRWEPSSNQSDADVKDESIRSLKQLGRERLEALGALKQRG